MGNIAALRGHREQKYSAPKKTTKKEPSKAEKKEKLIENESKIIYEWLKTHEGLSLNFICKRIGLDRANFYNHFITPQREMRPDVLQKFKKEIEWYGYGK